MVCTTYLLSTYLMFYTIGLMQSASFRNELFAIWASFLLIGLGSVDSISAYSLEDNEQRKRYTWQMIVKTFSLGWLIALYEDESHFTLPLWLLYSVTLLKTGERIRAFKLASQAGLARNTRLIADFMGYEHELSNQNEVDPAHMEGYNYLVTGEDQTTLTVTPPFYHQRLEINDEVVTIHKIWHCKGRLLTSRGDPDDQLKDICLSFALYKLICRRFSGYPLWECSQEKTWNFVRYGLLSKEDDYERPFRVIEVELSFLFDRLYTKYPVIFEAGRVKYKIIELVCLIIGCWVAASVLGHYHPPKDCVNLKVSEFNIDVLVTGVVVIFILSMEVIQIFFIIFSDWAKVLLLCKYVQNPSWQANICIEKMIGFICRGRLFKPWERKICQYSVLRSFNYSPSRLLYNCLTSDFLDRPGKGRKGITCTKLPAEVKKAIILSLKSNGQTLSNGEASLCRNGVENELSWACRLETNTHVIMVWHIATSLCELALSKSVLHTQRRQEYFIVATSLSKYCAYLLAFAPRFLPDSAYVSEFIFDQVVIETSEFLKKCKSMEKRFEKMMTLGDGDSVDTVTERGAVLAKRLMRGIEDEELRWKILADFWAEMMLFVAPSDDATLHAGISS
ncbi:hypothetical protein L1049_009885 [Liquidambar formosana]|uniref:DUF4220 domain-containing protein n=1 Tax=Liquidambar formosana TaxID=63359 RepID=A0AAP0NA22_LIQFO